MLEFQRPSCTECSHNSFLRILCALFLRRLVSNFMAYMSGQLMKVAFKEPVIRPLPLPDERQAILEQIRTKVSLYLFLFAVCHPFSTELCQTVLLHQPIKYRAKDLELSSFSSHSICDTQRKKRRSQLSGLSQTSTWLPSWRKQMQSDRCVSPQPFQHCYSR